MKTELEEAARKWYSNTKLFDKGELNAFIAGAKWMQERMFTKDDIITAFYTDSRVWKNSLKDWEDVCFEEWFSKQFKKK